MTGDILSVTIGAPGWYADIVIAGLGTGGTYDFGLGANNDPATGTPKIAFTVVSLGYDASGNATTITRTVYATHAVRKAYPSDSSNEESFSTNTTVRVALSDYIFQKDATGGGNSGTAPVVSILAGFYTKTGVPNNASGAGFAVTNSSTAAYPKVVGNWSYPGFQRVTGDFPLRAVAFHGTSVFNGGTQAFGGQMNIACVKFTAADTHSHTATTTVAAPAIDSTLSALDAVPVIEHAGTMAVSSLTQGDALTCNFTAYPIVGDSGSVLTSVGGAAAPSGLIGPITMLLDKSGPTHVTWAAFSSTGNDSTGACINRASYGSDAAAETAALATPFLTPAGALSAIAAYNNSHYSQNTFAGGKVIAAAGTYAWPGANPAGGYGTVGTDWCTITHASNTNRAGVQFTSLSGDAWRIAGPPIKFDDITLAMPSAFFVYQNLIWFNKVDLSSSATAAIVQTPHYLTHCVIGAMTDGLAPYTVTDTSQPMIVRGNALSSSFSGPFFTYTVLGNSRPAGVSSGPNLVCAIASQTIPASSQPIIAYNIMRGSSATALILMAMDSSATGLAVVQNLFENPNSAGSTAGDIGTNHNDTSNCIIWHNVFVGQRLLFAYNETGSTAYQRDRWSVKNNLVGDVNIKSDTFTGAGGANGARIGNWPVLYGVGMSGNIWGENIVGSGASGDFLSEFIGLKSIQPATSGQPPGGSPNAAGYLDFVSDLSWHTGSSTAGNGDYHINPTSPAKDLQRDLLLPYDLAGTARGSLSAAGAYHYGSSYQHGLWFAAR